MDKQNAVYTYNGILFNNKKKNEELDFPGDLVVKNPPANSRDTGPWSREMPHASEQLSPCTTSGAHVPQLLKPMCSRVREPHKRSHHNEKPMRHK